MAGEWQFLPGREDPQAVVGPLVRRRADERRLGQVRPGRDRLHLLARHDVAVEHHGDRVALEWHLGEYVDLLERERLHPGLLSRGLPGRSKGALRGGDLLLVPLVERPLLDPPRPHQPGAREDLQMLARGGLADPELLSDEHAADPVLDEVAVYLRREVRPRPLQPGEDLEPALVGQSLGHVDRKHLRHFANWLSLCQDSRPRRSGEEAAVAKTIDRENISATYGTIRPYIRVTPVLELDAADLGLSAFRPVLKLEQLQCSGSFKARGAFANLLMRKIPAAGVVAASGGNHGVAVAYPRNASGYARGSSCRRSPRPPRSHGSASPPPSWSLAATA